MAGVVLYSPLGAPVVRVYERRVMHATIEERYDSDRGDLFTKAVKQGTAHPVFGLGLNGFWYLYGTYPHNFFLEAFCEGGRNRLVLCVGYSGFVRFWRDSVQTCSRFLACCGDRAGFWVCSSQWRYL